MENAFDVYTRDLFTRACGSEQAVRCWTLDKHDLTQRDLGAEVTDLGYNSHQMCGEKWLPGSPCLAQLLSARATARS